MVDRFKSETGNSIQQTVYSVFCKNRWNQEQYPAGVNARETEPKD